MGMKFDMGSQTLSTLTSQSRYSSDDLGGLIRQLVDAAQPLEGKFNGQRKAAFDQFKARSDEVTAGLNAALAKFLGGQTGMDKAFTSGDQEAAENANQSMASANFDAARFGGR